jgi:hypothetical protein
LNFGDINDTNTRSVYDPEIRYWVIKPDGTELLPPDFYRALGKSFWRLVKPGELAIRWSKVIRVSNDPQKFEVAKLPVDGLTPEQLATVRKKEQEIAKRFDGKGYIRYVQSIGGGWNLRLGDRVQVLNQETVVGKNSDRGSVGSVELGAGDHQSVSEKSVSFEMLPSGRAFKCTCGYANALSKSERKGFQDGQLVEVTCVSCNNKGMIKR